MVEAVLAASFKRDGDRPVSPDLVRQHVGDLQQTRLAETPSRRPGSLNLVRHGHSLDGVSLNLPRGGHSLDGRSGFLRRGP